jgi:hypothetical protein
MQPLWNYLSSNHSTAFKYRNPLIDPAIHFPALQMLRSEVSKDATTFSPKATGTAILFPQPNLPFHGSTSTVACTFLVRQRVKDNLKLGLEAKEGLWTF